MLTTNRYGNQYALIGVCLDIFFLKNYNNYFNSNIPFTLFRLFWIIIPITMLIFGSYLVFELAAKFLIAPTFMIIDTPQSILSVPFPAVTYCHPQTVLDHKAREFVQNM